VTYSWVRQGERKRVPYENPQGRRYNALVLYAPEGPAPALDWYGTKHHLTADDLLGFLLVRPPCPVPLVVALDNASFHRRLDVQEALPALWARGIYLYYLPPYSPELNDGERLFRRIKHHELPERTYTPLTALVDAVDAAFTRCAVELWAKHLIQPRLAA
jgi:putative transposase